MLIKTIPVGQLEANCYIVTDEKTLGCAVIDPGDESNTIMDYIEDNHLTVKAILLTHGHFDHTGAVRAVHEETGAPAYICRKDVQTTPRVPFMELSGDWIAYYDDGDTVDVDGLHFEVMATPGHSLGSVTLRCGDALFTGDTLFHGSCGRTDLPGGDMTMLLESLRTLTKLEGDLEVYPGHMEATTLDRERASNYFVRYAWSEE